jgi:arginine exporter protein ArgO
MVYFKCVAKVWSLIVAILDMRFFLFIGGIVFLLFLGWVFYTESAKPFAKQYQAQSFPHTQGLVACFIQPG